ncbi:MULTISPECIES: asparagine synthase (glutamine-hydrolyzing) [unclassified Pseudomonas]|uniref:asparagine synthase (glutamine-hydrolyzing) n=1 Tax=unclassified Pseudomonas TaxID=196821 RepID=UPI000C86A061|nr:MULTISPECIES: asparagine synthase (glutamine-hydrolyzing) [unclassified Pseudomonas]NWA91064.1 asparagine synthase (glutamine-hydrolyzing) [Pseudomonas sp. D8002]PMU23841.1 asparagine synthase (glutamine-hydrolyzing) [Pseudomonas sp. GP01-A9]PMU28976.1 asparagine synthase (glutamine-hydrolyzing) [Pseudomonas sp. GP01-A13]PMU37706.1 asparagine synthase (glutamine-hydrolyzing) [Pseudomonas sp. GP01-A14]PMU38499.1 asparagine synthase (glutamine-hydrolyzing) [Pseudomonas sp. GP01-A8]
MCGFSGYFTNKKFSTDESSLLEAMGRSIINRGPDGGGYWFDSAAGIGLSHRRLAIVDLTAAGHQPMHSSSGRFVIAFNGEIYNHGELRALLEESGLSPTWNGHSDTETLLECFEHWGIEKTLQATVGMFAIALWDTRQNELVLARDRLGEKPLYWGWQNDVLLFGSELKALKIHPAFCADIDRDALALYLRHNYIPAPYSIYQGIEKLKPGHYVRIAIDQRRSDVKALPFWSFNRAVEAGLASPLQSDANAVVDTLEAQLSESIGMQMLADVPLGAFLSGGVDSSLVVGLMQKQSPRPVKTFTIGFSEAGFNEAEHALAVSRHLGTEHTEIYVQSKDALDVIPDLPNIYCEPFADSSQIPTFLVSRLARQQVTVTLSGDAGDELFGGYNPYQFAPRIWGKISQVPLPLRRFASATLRALPIKGKVEKLVDILDTPSREDFYRQLVSHWKTPSSVVIGAKEPITVLDTASAWPATQRYEEWMMAMDAQTYMADDILVKVDRAAMASSLETRVPMLDHRVVELAWRIPLDMKIRGGVGKWVLREVLYRHVPRELIERPKKGFSIPIATWLRGPLRDWSESLLDEGRLRREGFFHPAPIRRAWEQHLSGRADHSSKLWGVLMFQAWLEEQGR